MNTEQFIKSLSTLADMGVTAIVIPEANIPKFRKAFIGKQISSWKVNDAATAELMKNDKVGEVCGIDFRVEKADGTVYSPPTIRFNANGIIDRSDDNVRGV